HQPRPVHAGDLRRVAGLRVRRFRTGATRLGAAPAQPHRQGRGPRPLGRPPHSAALARQAGAPMSLDFSRYTALTFDCYGTLIDWETGIAAALEKWAKKRRLALPADGGLALFAKHETECERAMPETLYRDLLGHVLDRVGEELGGDVDADDRATFGGSVGDWPAFDDSADALKRLKKTHRLCILSNVDRAS